MVLLLKEVHVAVKNVTIWMCLRNLGSLLLIETDAFHQSFLPRAVCFGFRILIACQANACCPWKSCHEARVVVRTVKC